MQIIEKNINEIKPYEKNPRKNEDAVKYVANSIKEFGFKVPVVIDKNGVIVAGHTRYKASQELGLETIPCVVADDLTPEQIKAFRIADNKTAEQAGWDTIALGDELRELMDFDMTEFGFGDFELTLLTQDLEPTPYDKEIENEYSSRESEFLFKKRIIINYTDETEADLLELLGLEEFDKVVYDIEELV